VIISISYDRTKGIGTMAKVEAIVLDACEKEPSGRMELIEILGMAVETLPDYVKDMRIVRLPKDGAESCEDFKSEE
jgi:hypothetical protein